jgi:phosphoribosylformylglycinamidine (FGAM) synthase-like enzyme
MDRMRDDALMFSESNSRFLITTRRPDDVLAKFRNMTVPAASIGVVDGESLNLTLPHDKLEFSLEALRSAYAESLGRIVEP